MKKKITLISALAVVLSLSLVLVLTGAVSIGAGSAPVVRAAPLERRNLEASISLAGTVYSAQSTEVHSSMHFPVATVHVRVGDRVSEGDLLAVLDMSLMQAEVAQLQASLASAQAATNQNLVSARNSLEAFRRNLESGTHPALLEARFGVTSAEMAAQAAEVDLSIARSNLANARRDLRDYRRYVRDHHYDHDDGFDPTLSGLRATVLSFEAAYEMARSRADMTSQSLAKAVEGYHAVQVLNDDAIVDLESMVRSAQIATDFSDMRIAIQWMQGELEKAEIRAPAGGTVTAVNAEPGGHGAGLLFIIQDTENLIVRTNIREFDIASVSLGDMVSIRPDAMEGAVFTGTLSRIAPTSTTTAYGSNQGGAGAEFECEVAVSPGEGGLRIGMNARLSIVTHQESGVFALPHQAVTTNDAGEKIVLIAAPQEGGGFVSQAVPVTTGMQNGQLIQVFAPELADGTLVIRNAAGTQAGIPVTPHMYG